MTIENQADVDGILRVGRIVARVRDAMLAAMEPGMTTRVLDDYGRGLLEAEGARSAPQLAYDFPGATCISINEEAAHGVPGDRVIQPGDMVNVDVSAELDGYFADTGGSGIVPPASPLKQRLCRATRQALQAALEQVTDGARLNSLGKAVQKVARQSGFRIIRNLAGHGVGRGLHEYPTEILSFFDPDDDRVLRAGQVIAVEPFLSTTSRFVTETGDGWTLAAPKGNLSAQYEHTVIVTRGKPIIATASP